MCSQKSSQNKFNCTVAITMILWVHIRLFGYLVLITGIYNVKAWTYHYNNEIDMDWTTARQWCQNHFTDIVAIQNHAEVEHLNQLLPFNKAYYWIGIRKIDGYWTWVGTKKRLDPEAANWAENEPNNKGSGQDCVEIYIKRGKETAKWNDERCTKKKATVCYLASCSKESCSEHAECVEIIGSYECQCHPGFMGPRCEEVAQCSPIENPPQGFVKCDGVFGAFHFNSSCQFQCGTGFKLGGPQRLRCLASGHWDNNTLPVCQAVQCLPIIDAPGGWSMNCTHPLSIHSFNSSCEFKCEEGFELKGSNTTWCDQTGHWTHKLPTCQVVTCNAILAPANGHLTCADPLGKFSFRSSCNVSCDEGYKFRGKAPLTCLRDGNWSAQTPACEVIKCDPLKPMPHGSLQCYDPVEQFAYGSSCWLKCDFGFVLNGTNSTHCTKEGNWSHIPPVCQAIQCPSLSDALSYGNMTCTHPLSTNSYNSSCEFKCEEGFVLKGADSTHCDHTGHWTHSTPICTAVACDPLVTPAKSHLACTDPLGKFSFRSSCNTTCEEGYTLKGETTLTCLSDGSWSESTPACEVIRCDALESVQHGSLHCQDHLGNFSYGSLCWLECGAGFTFNGSNSTYCTSQGKWSHEFPVCQAQQCSPLINPSHGTVTCTHPNGQFSFGTVCEVSCLVGFKLHGTPRMECLEMGKWTDTPPFCSAQQCPHLTAPVNGWVNCSHPHSLFSYGSQCFLGCETGFEITGEPGMECSTSGNWNQEMPSCAAVRCEPLSLSHLPELGPPPSMKCSHPHGNFSFGSQCMFQCAESQELSGTSRLTCTSRGSWTNSPPSCIVKEMSVSAGMLMYAAVGATSSAGLLLLGGLIFLLIRQFSKKDKKFDDPVALLAPSFLNH
ncbi:P-selectin isoform X1 [Onychostoma macrolepis]|uniref:P-selectin isoform X1 n=1 Tax=Onychostoma macrolepis TaxID=369639 RepID=UPI00272CCEDB|nr:P-selectin isoform X1 [Onychostoma macrolepis]